MLAVGASVLGDGAGSIACPSFTVAFTGEPGNPLRGASTFRSRDGAASTLGGGGGSAVEIPVSEGGNIGGALGEMGDISALWPYAPIGVVPRGVDDCIPSMPSAEWLPTLPGATAPM